MTRKLLAEFLGTMFLLIGVVGSAIMGWGLADGNDAVALLANSIATGAILYVAITILGPVSGAHFNPAVTLAFLARGEIAGTAAAAYIAVQIAGGVTGVWIAHGMFDQSVLQFSDIARSGPGQWLAETVATFGLVLVIFGGLRWTAGQVPPLVAVYITGAYWFTASTSFANPAVTLARSLTGSPAGIDAGHAPLFIVMQLVGAGLAVLTARVLFR